MNQSLYLIDGFGKKNRTRINHKHSNHKVDLKTRQETFKKSTGSDCDELVD